MKLPILATVLVAAMAAPALAQRHDYRDYDRGDRYRSHGSRSSWSINVGFGSGGYRDYSHIGFSYSSRGSNWGGHYSYRSYEPICNPPVIYHRPVVYHQPVVRYEPVYCPPTPVYYEAPRYQPRYTNYRYNDCDDGYRSYTYVRYDRYRYGR